MKTLQNIGWYSLTFLSFIMVYSFIQGVGLEAMRMGASEYVAVPIYVLLAGIFTFVTYSGIRQEPLGLKKRPLTNTSGCLPWYGPLSLLPNSFCQMIHQSINRRQNN